MKTIFEIVAPEHTVWVDGVAIAVGVGFNVTVAVETDPTHPFAVGVIAKFTFNIVAPVLVKVPAILFVPVFAIPVVLAVLSLAHA